MEGDEEGIFSKALEWKPLLLLKIEIKQNLDYPNKHCVISLQIQEKTDQKKLRIWTLFTHWRNIIQSSSTFIKLSGPISEVKEKSAIINDWENIIAYWEGRIQAKRDVGEQVWFVTNTVCGSGGSTTLEKFCNFYYYLSLETVFPRL